MPLMFAFVISYYSEAITALYKDEVGKKEKINLLQITIKKKIKPVNAVKKKNLTDLYKPLAFKISHTPAESKQT